MRISSRPVAQDPSSPTLAPANGIHTATRCNSFVSPHLNRLRTEAVDGERLVLGWRLFDGCEVLRVDNLVHVVEPDGHTLCVDFDGDERLMSDIVAATRAEVSR